MKFAFLGCFSFKIQKKCSDSGSNLIQMQLLTLALTYRCLAWESFDTFFSIYPLASSLSMLASRRHEGPAMMSFGWFQIEASAEGSLFSFKFSYGREEKILSDASPNNN